MQRVDSGETIKRDETGGNSICELPQYMTHNLVKMANQKKKTKKLV